MIERNRRIYQTYQHRKKNFLSFVTEVWRVRGDF